MDPVTQNIYNLRHCPPVHLLFHSLCRSHGHPHRIVTICPSITRAALRGRRASTSTRRTSAGCFFTTLGCRLVLRTRIPQSPRWQPRGRSAPRHRLPCHCRTCRRQDPDPRCQHPVRCSNASTIPSTATLAVGCYSPDSPTTPGASLPPLLVCFRLPVSFLKISMIFGWPLTDTNFSSNANPQRV